MNKLLVICGPTATGKTQLALQIVQDYKADLVSADSRQVYRGMDIATGRDMPGNFKYQISNIKLNQKLIGYFTDGKTRLWGLDLVDPDEEFSVTDFVRFAVPIIKTTWSENRLPIVVGGTGLYFRALLGKSPDIYFPRNSKLRKELEKKPLSELQTELRRIDLDKFQNMNNSDVNNRRRLVRAIEVVYAKKDYAGGEWELLKVTADLLRIGLTAPIATLTQRISERVDIRIKQGVVAEVTKLIKNGYSWNLPSMSALGIRQWQPYFEKGASLEYVRNKWIQDEVSYVKRQLTWFKKEPGVVWFDISVKGYPEIIFAEVEKWYAKPYRYVGTMIS